MKLSVSTYGIIPHVGIDAGFAMIARAGFDCVDLDLMFMYPWADIKKKAGTPWMSMSDGEMLQAMKPYKDAMQKYGLFCGQAHALDPTYMPDPDLYKQLLYITQRQIMLCHYLDCHYLIIHPAHHLFYEEYLPAEQEWELNIQMFSQLIPWLKKYNVIACLENMYTEHNGASYAAPCQKPEEACRYIDTLNEMASEKRFAFCLDTGHAMFAGLELRNTIRTLGDRLVALHLNDNDGVHDQHRMPYMGKVDWERLVDGLREIDYAYTLNFETSFKEVPTTLLPESLQYTAAAGRLLAKRISERPNSASL